MTAPTTSSNPVTATTELPSDRVLKRLKLSREVAWFLLSRGYDLPDHPPLIKTPEGSRKPGAVFDPARVDRVIAAFGQLRHTKGRWAGTPIIPDAWQVAYFLAPVFGWVHFDDELGDYVRVVREAYMDVPRKNGKSTMSGGIGIYLTGADREPGAEVVAAASTRDQAGFVFQPIKNLVERAPALRGKFIARTGKILHPRSGSYFQVISSAADAQHGANLHGAIIDELHIHKTPDLVETLETGTGSRDQPLVVYITTADDGKPNTIYSRKRRYVEQLASNVFQDPGFFGVVFGVPDTADPFKPRNWAIANPGYPISPTHAYLESAAKKAKNSPAELAKFKRLHLGVREKQNVTYINMKKWDANAGPKFHAGELAGRYAYGGLDLGSVSDLTALCWLFPFTNGRIGYDVKWHFWTPEDNLDALDKRTANAASGWVQDGWLTLTPGEVTDYEFIEQQIIEDMTTYQVATVGFDYWNATQVANNLLDEGVPLVETRQGYKTMSPAMKEIQRLIMMGRRGAPRLRHGGNPVMRWMTDNLAVTFDPAGNVKPDKAKAADKIDGWSALANAMSEAMADQDNDFGTGSSSRRGFVI